MAEEEGVVAEGTRTRGVKEEDDGNVDFSTVLGVVGPQRFLRYEQTSCPGLLQLRHVSVLVGLEVNHSKRSLGAGHGQERDLPVDISMFTSLIRDAKARGTSVNIEPVRDRYVRASRSENAEDVISDIGLFFNSNLRR